MKREGKEEEEIMQFTQRYSEAYCEGIICWLFLVLFFFLSLPLPSRHPSFPFLRPTCAFTPFLLLSVCLSTSSLNFLVLYSFHIFISSLLLIPPPLPLFFSPLILYSSSFLVLSPFFFTCVFSSPLLHYPLLSLPFSPPFLLSAPLSSPLLS